MIRLLSCHIEACAVASTGSLQLAGLVPCLRQLSVAAAGRASASQVAGHTHGDVLCDRSCGSWGSRAPLASSSSDAGSVGNVSLVSSRSLGPSHAAFTGQPWPLSISALVSSPQHMGFSSSSRSSPSWTQQHTLCEPTAAGQQQQQQWPILQLPLQQASLPLLQQQRQRLQPAAHQLQQQRGVKQLRPYNEAPKLPPRFRRPDKDGRMNRMVIRVPPQVQVAVQDGHLVVTGKAGSTSLQLSTLDPSGMVAWRCLTQSAAAAAAGPGTGSLLLLVSPSKRHWRSIQTHIDNAVHGVMQGYLVGLTVQGVGYRLEPVPEEVVAAAVRARRGDAAAADSSARRPMFWEQEAEKSNIAYPHKQPTKAVRLKVGYTKAAIFPLPEGVLGFCVKPTLMYLYGVDKQLVTSTAAAIRAVRKPNAYTGNGIQLVGETIRLKQRAGSK